MPIIVLILAIAGLIWGAVFALRGSLVGGCAAYLIAACCFSGDFWSFDAAGLTWSVDRFVLFAVVVTFAAQSALGKSDFKPLTRGDGLLACFVGLLLISTFTHDWRYAGPDEESVLMHLVNGYLVPVAIFVLARNARLTQSQLRWVYAIFGCFGVYLAVTALCEVSGLWALVFPKYIANPEVGIHFGRARGPMLQSARLGTYLVVCAAFGLAYLAQVRERKRAAIVTALAAVPLFLGAIYCTYTRSVWMGAGLATLVALGCILPTRWRAVLLLVTIVAGATLVAAKGEQLIAFKRETNASDTRRSTYMRASFAFVSWKMFQDKPWTGFGFGHFRDEVEPYLGDRTTSLQLEQIRGYIHHNTILSLLVELGVLGPILFAAFFTCWLRSAWRTWRDQTNPTWIRVHGLLFLVAFAPYLFQLLFREVSYSPVENSLLFFVAGTACSLSKRRAIPERRVSALRAAGTQSD